MSSGNLTNLKLGSAIIMTDYNNLETPAPFIPKEKSQQFDARSFHRPDQPNPVVMDRLTEPSKSALIAIDSDSTPETREKSQATQASGQIGRNSFEVPNSRSPAVTQSFNPTAGQGRNPPGTGVNQPRLIIPSGTISSSGPVWSGNAPASTPSVIAASRSPGRITLEPPSAAHSVPTGNHTGTLMCQVCGEGDLEEAKPECKEMRKMDCSSQYPPGSKLYCLTRETQLSNGESLCRSWNLYISNEFDS